MIANKTLFAIFLGIVICALIAEAAAIMYIKSTDQEDGQTTAVDSAVVNSTATPATSLQTAAWGSPVQIGEGGGTISRGTAVDSQNRIHEVWRGTSNGSAYIAYARSDDGGKTWTAVQELSLGRGASLNPNVTIGVNDSVHVAWTERTSTGSSVMYRRSTDSGSTWSSAQNISGEVFQGISAPAIAADTNNRVHIAWHEGNLDENGSIARLLYSRSIDNGEQFDAPRQLNTGAGHAAWPRFTIAGDGSVVAIAWRDNRRNPDWDVYVAVSTDAGATFTEYAAQASADREWDPDIAVDRHNVIHLSYMQYMPNGIIIQYSRSADYGKTWSSPVTLSEYTSEFPFWAVSPGSDTLWLFWKDERDAPPREEGMRRIQGKQGRVDKKADVALKYSQDGGVTWSPLELVTNLGETEVKFPSPAVGPNNTPVITWSDTHSGTELLYVSSRSR